MSRLLIPAGALVRLALKTCFEKDTYDVQLDGLLFLRRKGLDRYAMARAVLRHIAEDRNLYCKYDDRGIALPHNYHGEVALQDDDLDIAYMHFILSAVRERVWVRAHANCFPASLPW
jgi:hypothetical protein